MYENHNASGATTSAILTAVNSDLGNAACSFDRTKMVGLKHMLDAMDEENLNSYQRRAFQDAMLDYGVCKYMNNKDRDTRVIRCAFLLAKRNMLRKSNIVYDSKCLKTPMLNQMKMVPNDRNKCIKLVFSPLQSKSKSVREDEPREIECCCHWTPMRPCLMHELLDITYDDWSLKNVDAPLFRMSDRRALNAYKFDKAFDSLCFKMGLPREYFKPHGFRIGGCTDEVQAGTPKEEVRKKGGWKAERSVSIYVRDANPNLPEFQHKWITSSFSEGDVRPFTTSKRLGIIPTNWYALAARASFTPRWVNTARDLLPNDGHSGASSSNSNSNHNGRRHTSNRRDSVTLEDILARLTPQQRAFVNANV